MRNQVREIVDGVDVKVELLNYIKTSYTGLIYGMEKYYPTWKIDENHKVIKTGVNVFSDLFGSTPKVDKWTFSTNAVAINGLHKIPVIGFGPGQEEMAHAPNEKVPVDHLVKASAFYAYYCAEY
ncbi:MAG: M20/M25/M40 family metallo-hydrolase [Ignavibacteriaceae bacterium]